MRNKSFWFGAATAALVLFALTFASFSRAQVVGGGGGSGGGGTVNQGTPASSGPWIFVPWLGGSAVSTANPLPINIQQVAGATATTNPCSTPTYAPIAITTSGSATTTKIITGAGSKQTYICSMILFSSAAASVGVVEGTTTTTACDTGTAGVFGGATAATGFVFGQTTGQGYAFGSGTSAVAQTATAADNVCIFISAVTTQLSGGVYYGQQ